jgi:hypothetical protein
MVRRSRQDDLALQSIPLGDQDQEHAFPPRTRIRVFTGTTSWGTFVALRALRSASAISFTEGLSPRK